MARIRTIKPTAFISESLAEVSVEAERTFFGLLTQADDHGRHRDNAAIIAGVLWPLRAEHTSVHVEDDLCQLAEAGMICRYTGCDGKRYLHVVSWFEHQKIDKPSQSWLPSCPEHYAAARCGVCKGTCKRRAESSTTGERAFAEGSPKTPRTVETHVGNVADGSGLPIPSAVQSNAEELGPRTDTAASLNKTPAHSAIVEDSAKPPRGLDEPSAPGNRILDPGIDPSGRAAPGGAVSAKDLIGEYVAACEQRPPGDVLGHLGRIAKKLLAEGIAAEHVRAGLHRFAEIQGHPSCLPSLVNDAMNAPGEGLARPGKRPSLPGHRAWTNPADVATAYAEEL